MHYSLNKTTNGKIILSLQPFKKILRGRAEVARWAHNPKVVGSNPAPATK